MANDALDTDNAWDLVLSAINRSNITLPVPGSDQPAVKINGKSWELIQPATEQARNLLSLFLPLCQPPALSPPRSPSNACTQSSLPLSSVTVRSRPAEAAGSWTRSASCGSRR